MSAGDRAVGLDLGARDFDGIEWQLDQLEVLVSSATFTDDQERARERAAEMDNHETEE